MNVNLSLSFKFFAVMELFAISLSFSFDIAFDRVLQIFVRCSELGGYLRQNFAVLAVDRFVQR
jgi:hypothetical protein